MDCGARFSEGSTVTRKQVWVWTVVALIAMALVPYFFLIARQYLWFYGMYWILFFFSTPATAFGLTKIMEWQEGNALGRGLNRMWGFLGSRSFEIYLCHLAFYELCLALKVQGWPKWILIAAIGTGIGIVYHQVVYWATAKWKAHKREKSAA